MEKIATFMGGTTTHHGSLKELFWGLDKEVNNLDAKHIAQVQDTILKSNYGEYVIRTVVYEE